MQGLRWMSGLEKGRIGGSGGSLRPYTPQTGLSPARFASYGCFLLVFTGAASPQWITWLRHCGFPSPAGSGAYIHTCGPVGVVGERG